MLEVQDQGADVFGAFVWGADFSLCHDMMVVSSVKHLLLED